ncbi:hypothetical protein J6590_006286 [Homalodisca vitripennis]|nr:hypothetical protein J6590_006286 [Homalodisca vitripennis]
MEKGRIALLFCFMATFTAFEFSELSVPQQVMLSPERKEVDPLWSETTRTSVPFRRVKPRPGRALGTFSIQ